MEPKRKAKRVVLDGPRVTIEWEDGGESSLRVHANVHEALRDAALCAAHFGTYVFNTARQEALSYL